MVLINQIKNRLQNLSERTNIMRRYLDYETKKRNLKEINKELQCLNVWQKSDYSKILAKKRSSLEIVVTTIESLDQNIQDLFTLFQLSIDEQDQEILEEITFELDQLNIQLKKLEFRRMFSLEYDSLNCYMDIQSGSGGTEAQDWASMILRMYSRWAETKGFKIEIIEASEGEITGLKSATLRIFGEYAYGWLRTETGIHRLVRKSPFDANHRRHTSFASAFVYPDIDNNIEVNLKLSDLRIDVYRASGAGGQHVNTTESAVRITHLPTNIVVQCQNERSQHKNKDQAIKQLRSKLFKLEKQKQNAKKQADEEIKSNIGWGNQIRSYILDNSRIKDLRTGLECRNTQAILNGDLDKFIETSLKAGL
ncbi:peptide chain release factor 2 [Candidatus Photodesmus katoptron]|nr:peptide chain release factor 2 [Candidatus Photodesmus katoptron]